MQGPCCKVNEELDIAQEQVASAAASSKEPDLDDEDCCVVCLDTPMEPCSCTAATWCAESVQFQFHHALQPAAGLTLGSQS